jgi:Amt family ammonium transporter
MKPVNYSKLLIPLLLCFLPNLSFASYDKLVYAPLEMTGNGHVAWELVASILVIFMTIPGIVLFYGGFVRRKNVLSMLSQCFIITALASLLWVIIGYSLAFTPAYPFVGGFKNIFLQQVPLFHNAASGELVVFIFFQMGFSIISSAIIIGSFAERIKFSAVLVFSILWQLFVYYPIAHWVWGGGWLDKLGVLDYAGGSVVHINAGVAGLVAALIVGKRIGFNRDNKLDHPNILLVGIGTAFLWVGWFGFNAGSAFEFMKAPTVALMTQIAACAALLTWMTLSWIFTGKPSVIGTMLGAVTGLVAITPASGYVGLFGAICIGIISSAICFFLIKLKYWFNYDDSLDAFGIHGIGGIVGSILTGIFFSKALGGIGHPGFSMGYQVVVQLIDVGAVIVWSGTISAILLFFINWAMGLRVPPEAEEAGLDVTEYI